MGGFATTTLDLSPYLPRLALQWLAEQPELPFLEIDGTVAFVDISGFTKLSERLARLGKVGAEELTDAIGGCFRELLAVAYANRGNLIKFGGDALLLLFRGPDHALRATSAAAGMRATLKRIGSLETPGGRVRLRMSVGVHTGRFHFFLVGSLHKELLITGPAATQTALMEQTAEAGEIVVSTATAAALPSRLVGEPKGNGYLLRGAEIALDELSPADDAGYDVDVTSAIPLEVRAHLLGGGCEPEHRLTTVIFVRFENVDATIEAEGAARLAEHLELLLDRAQRAADEHGVAFLSTDVDKDGGKLILCAGAPRATGRDEEAALLVARAIIESGFPLPLKIGLNRGHVFAGEIGPPYRRTYTVMGDTVNLAARLMAAAAPGEILATAGVLDHSRTPFATRALPPFTVKGKARPVHAFSVGSPITGATAPVIPPLPVIGRAKESAALSAALDAARAGTGVVVEIVGEPGMGASRLVHELRASAPDVATFWTSGGPYAAATPYFPFRTLLRDVLGIARDAPLDEAAALLRAHVVARAPALVPWLPLIGITADVPMPTTQETDALSEEFRRSRLEAVVTELLVATLPATSILTFEDAQFFDEASVALVERIATVSPEHPWLVLVTRTTHEAESRRTLPGARSIALGPLDDDSARAFVDAATDDAPLSPHQTDAIVRRAGGNPMALRELVSAARSEAGVEGLPESLEGLMSARIDRLLPSDRTLIRVASVLGTVFDGTLLGSVLDEEPPGPDDAVWQRIAPYIQIDEGLYRFASPLVRDAAYEGLTFRSRRTLHERAAGALIACARDPEESAELLAIHFAKAGSHTETWRFARVAAARARTKYANVDAARFFEQALEASSHLASIEAVELIAVRESLGDALNIAGEYLRALAAYRVARRSALDELTAARLFRKEAEIADRLGRFAVALRVVGRGRALLAPYDDPAAARERARLSVLRSVIRQQQGKHAEAIKWSERAIAEAEASEDTETVAYGHRTLDWALDSLGRAGDREHLKKALSIYEETGDLKGQAIVLNNLGAAAYWKGHWDDAIAQYERSRLLYEQIGDVVGAAVGLVNVGEILLEQGRVTEADPFLRRSLRTARATGEREGIAFALSLLGRAAARGRNFDDALSLLEEAKAEYESLGDAAGANDVGARIAECLVLEGRSAPALDLLDGLIEKDRASGGTSPITALLLRTRAEALMQEGDSEGARASLHQSLTSATTRWSEIDRALTLRRIGALERRHGTPNAAVEQESASILRSLGVVETIDPPA
ncbi:MAG TPA: adenylate/guanylate cyclase domain-containing protein [Actinomycetota bacterium]|nr:adenylate/guanylate cyclase domain-containing protein [Actinomycetota bacterium]